MPSFDIVSKVQWAEVDNALQQTKKEIAQRYDFKDTGASIDKTAEGIVIIADTEGRVEAVFDVFQSKLVKRSVSLKHMDPQKIQPAGGGTSRQLVKVKEGIDKEHAKKLIEHIKQSKLKVQSAIHEDTVRVSGKSRDELQAAIRVARDLDLDIELQFVNIRN